MTNQLRFFNERTAGSHADPGLVAESIGCVLKGVGTQSPLSGTGLRRLEWREEYAGIEQHPNRIVPTSMLVLPAYEFEAPLSVTACERVLKRTCDAVASIVDAAESLKAVEV